MKIYYTNKIIFWNNESSDFLEKDKFDEYLNEEAWVQLSNVKSINWESHYSANFYATDNFEATYFKVVKNNQTYYFFIDDILFDGVNGKQYSLSLDLYNTYSIQLIDKLKEENPNVYFTRKHENRYYKQNDKRVIKYTKSPYIFQLPQYLQDVDNSRYPIDSWDIEVEESQTHSISWLSSDHGQIDDRIYDWGTGEYFYLRLKLSTKVNSIIPLSPYVYYPIRQYPSTDEKPNSYNKAIKYPSDYVVDLCSIPLPPSAFGYGAQINEFYTGETFENDSSIILFVPLYGNTTSKHLKNPIYFLNIQDDTYNIDYIDNEVALLSQQCTTFSIADVQLVLPYYFQSVTNNGYIDINTVGIDSIVASLYSNFYVYLYNAINEKMFKPNAYSTVDSKIPIIGDVYNNYLQNNGTSMTTEISLANEQKKITSDYITNTTAVGVFSGLLNIGLGSVAAAASGGAFGLDAIGGGISSILNTSVEADYNSKMNEFNYKKVVSTQEALKSDLKNQVGDFKDAYGKGQLMSGWTIHKTALPDSEKKRVFTDFYFNGYITNTIFKFNDYDNRINFNYFELKNVFALCSQYLKLPKSIMSSIAKQLESGVRLWKTSNFDYTLTLDNRENSYEIRE